MTFKELRKLSGMTQKRFSEYFGIPQRTIENWEGSVNKCPEYLLELMRYKLENEGFFREKDFVRIPQKSLSPKRNPAEANARLKRLVEIQEKLARKKADAEADALTLEMKEHVKKDK